MEAARVSSGALDPRAFVHHGSDTIGRLGTMRDTDLSIKTAVHNQRFEQDLKSLYARVSVFNAETEVLEPVSPSQLASLQTGEVWVNVVLSSAPAQDFKSSQPVLDWLEVLQGKFHLPALSLLNAVDINTDLVKVDRNETCLYVSMVAYTCANGSSKAVAEASEALNLVRARGMSHRNQQAQRAQNRLYSRVKEEHEPYWHRVSLCLTENALLSFFDHDHAFNQLSANRLLPNRLDFQYGLGFLFYKIVDGIVKLTPQVVSIYDDAICAVESMVLGTSQRPTFKQDVANTTELHVMRNELAMIKHIVAPTQRVVNTILTEYGNKPSKLVSAIAVDYLEEVGDELTAVNEDIEVAISNCEQVSGLIFNLSSYNDTNNGQALTIVATIFLPLTWICGIYGMNFEVLPELKWKLGYLYFWLVTICVALITLVLSTVPQGYFHRMGLQPMAFKAKNTIICDKRNKREIGSQDVSTSASV